MTNPYVGETRNVLTNGRIVGEDVSYESYSRQDSERGKPDFVMSKSELMQFNHCPQRWLKGYEGEETSATEWGQLVDALVLSGKTFDQRFAVAPQTYPDKKTGEAKPWIWSANYCKEWRAEQGSKKVVKFETHQEASEAAMSLYGDQEIRKLISQSKKQVMALAEYQDEETCLVIPLKVLLDLVPLEGSDYGKCLADLKTCTSAGIRDWTKAVFNHGYHVQAALYRDVYVTATGEDRSDWLHLLQENYAPWQVGKRLLASEFVELGRMKYLSALRRYCQCLKENIWPGYEDGQMLTLNGWAMVQPEPYMAEDAL